MNYKYFQSVLYACLLAAAPSLSAESVPTPDILPAQTLEGRVLVMPFDTSVSGELTVAGGARVSIGVEGDYRVYRALYAGKEHQAHVAIEGPPRRLAFDLKEERFREVLPSLRVELTDYGQFEQIVKAAGGTGGKVYEALGFAIVRLPREDNPAEAAATIGALPGVNSATIQLQGPLHVPM